MLFLLMFSRFEDLHSSMGKFALQLSILYKYKQYMNEHFTPFKNKSEIIREETFRISPVKVPQGAKQIGTYILGKTIGSGTYGKVHLGLHIPTSERVAVKIIDKMKLNPKQLERVHREIQILQKIMHPSLIQLYEIIQTQKSLLLVTEYMQNGELFNYIIQNKKLSQNQACQIFRQIVQGIQYMHEIGVAHRDIKPENILIDFNGRIKIIDFGLSNMYKKNQKLKTECGSPCYAAPEMIEGNRKYDPLLIDIWSAGIVLFAMIAGYLPFCDTDTSKLYKKILSGSFKVPTWISNDCKDLIQKILVTNPLKRASLKQIKQHPWHKKCSGSQQRVLGIDIKLHKIPIEMPIVEKIEKLGLNITNLVQNLQKNKKNKETALYYIIAKKMIKDGIKIERFVGSSFFKEEFIELLHTEDMNIDSTCIEVQSITPTYLQPQRKSPETNSSIELYNIKKSGNFRSIVKDFMRTEHRNKNQLNIDMMDKFYANNLQSRKKKINLKIEPEKIMTSKEQKAINLMKIYKINRNYTSVFARNRLLPYITMKSKISIENVETASTSKMTRAKRKQQIANFNQNQDEKEEVSPFSSFKHQLKLN